jgi:hypothetical protein
LRAASCSDFSHRTRKSYRELLGKSRQSGENCMTKDLYYTIPQYFERALLRHDNVVSLKNVSTDDFFLYQIDRRLQRDSILVWLSDAYLFSDMDFNNKPQQLKRGDYILVAKPEGSASVSSALIDGTGIGVGKLGELMGALNKKQMWTYTAPDWQEKQLRAKAWRERHEK